MKYEIQFWLSNNPNEKLRYAYSEFVEISKQSLNKYILSQYDEYGHHFKKINNSVFDYKTEMTAGVKVKKGWIKSKRLPKYNKESQYITNIR